MTTDPQVKIALISAAGVVIAAAFALLGIWFTQRQARAASNATKQIENQRADADAYKTARELWEASIKDLRQRVEDLSHEVAEQKETHRVEMLEQKNAHREQIAVLETRLADVEQRRGVDAAAMRLLRFYVRQLLAALRVAGVPAPEPPDGLVLELVE